MANNKKNKKNNKSGNAQSQGIGIKDPEEVTDDDEEILDEGEEILEEDEDFEDDLNEPEDTPAKKPKKTKEEKEAEKKAKEKAAKKKRGNRLINWLRDLRAELKKVVWPSFGQVMKNTGIVLLMVLVIGVFIWIFDALAHLVIEALISLFSEVLS